MVRSLFQAMALTVAVLLATGCVPWLRSAKPAPGTNQAAAKNAGQPGLVPVHGGQVTDKELDQRLPPPPPFYKPPESRDQTTEAESFVGSTMKLEVEEAARRFAKEIPNVKHIKICFSKMYGGWYLLLYAREGKKTFEHHYSWDAENKEWKVALTPKEVPPVQLEHRLKGEVADERCYLLQ